MTNEQEAALGQATHEFSKDWDYPPGWAATGKAFALFGAEWMEQNRWVPVKDALPEENAVVDVTYMSPITEVHETARAHYICAQFQYYSLAVESYVVIPNVIAWMPRITPYSSPKAENNE